MWRNRSKEMVGLSTDLLVFLSGLRTPRILVKIVANISYVAEQHGVLVGWRMSGRVSGICANGRRLNWSRAISELGMTNVPRAELRNRAGGRRRVNSIRGRLKGFRDVSLARRKFAYVPPTPPPPPFGSASLIPQGRWTHSGKLHRWLLRNPSSAQNPFFPPFPFPLPSSPPFFFFSLSPSGRTAASHKSNYTPSEIRFLFGHVRVWIPWIRRG